MSTKYYCDICNEEKKMSEFYKHKSKTSSSYSGISSKIEPIRFKGDKFVATVHIQEVPKEIPRATLGTYTEYKNPDICTSCAIKILRNLMKEVIIDKL